VDDWPQVKAEFKKALAPQEWERTPWHATQHAAWEALTKADAAHEHRR